MITIALFKELGTLGFVSTIEAAYVRRCSSETNKLKYVNTIWCTSREVSINKREINKIKIKISRLSWILVETVPLEMDRFKSKNGASVSEELALFNWSSAGYIRLNHLFKVNVINI